MPYLVRWLDNTFKTRKQTQDLLLPDVQEGVLTSHDYDLAVDFLPGWHKYYGEIGGITLGTLVAYYGHFHTSIYTIRHGPAHPLAKNPRWKPGRTFALTVGAYLTGKVIGQVSRLRAHIRFSQQLDDQDGFSRAMENVHGRMGGKRKLQFSIASLGGGEGNEAGVVGGMLGGIVGREEMQRSNRRAEEEESMGAWPTGGTPEPAIVDDSRPGNTSTSPSPPTTKNQPKTKWDEIRSVNARGAASSSWDTIRQSHERSQVKKNDSSNPSGGETWMDDGDPAAKGRE